MPIKLPSKINYRKVAELSSPYQSGIGGAEEWLFRN